ncbi:MAG: tetratricopeptide repeat protein [Nitrospiria bacterium]
MKRVLFRKTNFSKIVSAWVKGLALSSLLVLVPISLQAKVIVVEGDADQQKSWEVLKREAYYHFFTKDYLTAGTRLKLIEASSEAMNDPGIAREVKTLLGSLYLAWGMDRSAIGVFEELVEDTPPGENRDQLLLKVVKVQYERSRYGSALETYKLIPPGEGSERIETDRYFEQGQYLVGLSHYAAGSIQKGIKHLEAIPEDSPYFPFAQLTLAKSYYRLGDSPKSLQYLKDLSETDTRRNRSLTRLIEKSRLTWGQLLLDEGHFRGAHRILAHISRKSPFFPDSLFGMGWADFKEGNYLEAILTFQDLIKVAPDHDYSLEALTVLGHGYRKLSAFQTALDHYSEAIQVYGKRVAEIRTVQGIFEDPEAFDDLLAEYEVHDGPLASLLEDDRIHFWVSQYGDLVRLASYLDQKLHDMDVFEVMVDHREAVFRQYLPVVRRFLKETPMIGLRKKGEDLSTYVNKAIQKEGIPALASPKEAETFTQLSRAVSQSLILGNKFRTLELMSDQVIEHKMEWKRIDRWLKLALGEMVWKIKTEVPGRGDDLRRGVRVAMTNLSTLEKKHADLISSVPALEREIAHFRSRIKAARASLLEMRKRTHALRVALLPPLQGILMGASEKWINRIVRLVAAAELSQIQILDGKDGKNKP